jgi:hypothetical protein
MEFSDRALTLTVSPSTLGADGQSRAIVSALLADANGAPLVDQAVLLSVDRGSLLWPGTNDPLPSPTLTDSAGRVEAEFLAPTEAGVARVSAQSEGAGSTETEIVLITLGPQTLVMLRQPLGGVAGQPLQGGDAQAAALDFLAAGATIPPATAGPAVLVLNGFAEPVGAGFSLRAALRGGSLAPGSTFDGVTDSGGIATFPQLIPVTAGPNASLQFTYQDEPE